MNSDTGNLPEIRVDITADGSATLYRADIDEHYHSVKGALTESMHVYVRTGLDAYQGDDEIVVLEVGFGTGLNAVLTAMHSQRRVRYVSVELYPLPGDAVEGLGYHSIVDRDLYEAILNAPWNTPVSVTPRFVIEKQHADMLTVELPDRIGVVYFDAFAPEKQSEMWSEEIFGRLYKHMVPGGVLTTYCAKGAVRRMLGSVGFVVERLPGPPGGKREILRATKPVE